MMPPSILYPSIVRSSRKKGIKFEELKNMNAVITINKRIVSFPIVKE